MNDVEGCKILDQIFAPAEVDGFKILDVCRMSAFSESSVPGSIVSVSLWR